MAATTATAHQNSTSLSWLKIIGHFFYWLFALLIVFIIYKSTTWNWALISLFAAFLGYILILLESDLRGLAVFVFLILYFTVDLSIGVYRFLTSNAQAVAAIRESTLLTFLFGGTVERLIGSILLGFGGALLIVLIPLFLISLVSALYILALHEMEGVSWWDATLYIMALILGINSSYLVVENGQAMMTKEAARLSIIGGPGHLIIKQGNVVVLERGGKITRVVNAGVVKLKPLETIRNIFVLSPQSNWDELEHVLTRDRIPLKITMGIGYQIEPISEADKRPESRIAPNGEALTRILDDDLFQVYEGTIRKAALMSQATFLDKYTFETCNDKFCWDIVKTEWQKVAGGVPGNELRDYIMSHRFDELFELIDNGEEEVPAVRVNKRKIYEIEQAILEQIRPGKAKGLGVFVRAVDIGKIEFPSEARMLLLKHWGMPWQQGIQKISAESNVTNAQLEAQAMVIIARAKAQVRILEGQGEGEARAAFFREVLREMKREGVLGDEEMITTVLRQLINTMVTVGDLQAYIKLAGLLEPLSRRQLEAGSENRMGVAD